MAKLLPPLIEGTLPACYKEADGRIIMTIPFTMNRGVSKEQISGFKLKLKTTQSSSYLFSLNCHSYNIENSPYVIFNIKEEDGANKINIGQFYKAQIAYIDKNGNEGYYSSVGVIKITSQPSIVIAGLKEREINSHCYEYTGIYTQENDPAERVYNYQFIAYDSVGNVIADSGQMLHNSSNDTEANQSYDTFLLSQELELNKSYYIKYIITTVNGLTISSPKYRIMQKISIEPEIKTDLTAQLNFENGYVNIHLVGHRNEDGLEEPATGAFLLTRACEDTNYSIWDEISRFKLAAQNPSRWLWKDMTVEQGKTYRYSLQQYNDAGLYSNRILSNDVYVDFEDAFLFDGTKQLKIKYNPKVSSFKANVLESKIDTIGSQHPFIFRNGRVYYREFPISGLISYLMDEEKLFLNDDEFIIKEKTTNLTSDNIQAEREFKLKVLEWLTNGQPKLFRSPSEGNYIVRLMNSSLTPNDTVGRMLHTFNCTAYEIAEFNYKNLNDFNFISLKDPEVATLRWETIELRNIQPVDNLYYLNNNHIIYTLRVDNMIPGTRIYYKTEKDFEEVDETIQIGVTGSYFLDIGIPLKEVYIKKESGDKTPLQGSITYSFFDIAQNKFDKIDNVIVSETPTQQFIGNHDVIKEIEYVVDENGNHLKNPKVDIVEFYYIHARKRHIERVYKGKDGTLYADEQQTVALIPDPFELYAVGKWETIDQGGTEGPGYNPSRLERKFVVEKYVNPANGEEFLPENYDSSIYINESPVSVFETEDFEMFRPGKLTDLRVGNGVAVECAYQIRTIDYSIEENEAYPELKDAKLNYETTLNRINELLTKEDENMSDKDYEELQECYATVPEQYNTYILELIKAQEDELKAEGLV